MSMFRLSTTLYGHDQDVKTLAALNEDAIVSGSRDSTVRIWNRAGKSKDFGSSIISFKSDKFVNALAVYRHAGEVLIASAGNDNMINLTAPGAVFMDEQNEDDQYCLIGHTANVCTLDTFEGFILSGSWDINEKVWPKQRADL